VKIGVVSHQDRFAEQLALVDSVQADFVSIDDGTVGCEGNHRLVWKWLSENTIRDEWGIVLEDDALPVNDFRVQADVALSVAPTDVCSFYLGRQRPPQWMPRVASAVRRAHEDRASWILIDAVLHGVAIAMRGNRIESMLERVRESGRPIDEAMTQWCRCQWPVQQVGYSQPSLVEHSDLPTIVTHADGEGREKGRVAWRFGGRLDWDRRCVAI
jgi:hypothetical protein